MPNETIKNQIVVLTIPEDKTLPIEATVSEGPLLDRFEAYAAKKDYGIKKIDNASGTHSVFVIDREKMSVGILDKDKFQEQEKPAPRPRIYPMRGDNLDPNLIFIDPPINIPKEKRYTEISIVGDEVRMDTTDPVIAERLACGARSADGETRSWNLIFIDGGMGYQSRWRFISVAPLVKIFGCRMESAVLAELKKK